MNLPIFGSIDSFWVALAMVLAGCPAIYRSRVIVGFMAFDMLGGLAGSALGLAVSPAAYALAVALAVPMFWFARRWPTLYLTLPVLFCVDNFVMGSSDATNPLWAHFAGAIVSGVLAFAGFTAGTSAVRLTARLRAGALLQGTAVPSTGESSVDVLIRSYDASPTSRNTNETALTQLKSTRMCR